MGSPALYPPTSATAEADRRSLQGRRATNISTIYTKAHVVMTTIYLEYYLRLQYHSAELKQLVSFWVLSSILEKL